MGIVVNFLIFYIQLKNGISNCFICFLREAAVYQTIRRHTSENNLNITFPLFECIGSKHLIKKQLTFVKTDVRQSNTWQNSIDNVRRHYATSRKVAGSRPDEVINFFPIYLILPAALGPGVHSASNRN
jgi:hypothetical protein